MILDLFLGREAEGVGGMMYRLVFISQSCNMKPIIEMCTLPNKKFSNSVSNIILMLMLMPWIGYLQGVLVDFRTNALNESLN